MLRFVAALALIAVSLAAAGCGGDDDGAGGNLGADDWAQQFCTSVVDWRAELEEIGERVADLGSLSLESLRSAAADANAATDRLVDEIGELGAPDLDAGDEVRIQVEELTDVLGQQRDQIEEALETSDPSGAQALAAIGASISTMGQAFAETLRDIRDADASGELSQAFDDTDACDDVD